MSEISTLLDAVASILNAICWPLLVLIIVFTFKEPMGEFFKNLGEFTFKASASGLEASAKKFEVAANLGAATATSGDGNTDPNRVTNIGRTIEAYSDRQILKLMGKQVLWVDDNPSNNIYERKALEALGIYITTSLSTEEALAKIAKSYFDVIISDLSRTEDNMAGITLLDQLNQQSKKIPYIIYSSQSTFELRKIAFDHKAFGLTNIAEELFQFVLNAILISSEK